MKRVSTYCRICEPQCALIAQVEEQQVIKLQPNKEHPVHRGFACHKGLNFVELHNDPDRLNHPQRRTNTKGEVAAFTAVSWDEALTEIGEQISDLQDRHGEAALGFYVGNPSAFNSTGRDAARQFMRAVGARYTFGSGTQDCTNKFAASEAVFGTANLHPIPDFEHTDYLLCFGANPRISHASFVHMTDPMGALRGIVKRGGQVKHINPRRTESVTEHTGDLVQIKPDTDIYLLAALINEIRAADLVDTAWLAQHGDRVEELWQFVAAYPAARVAPVVGLSAQQIRTLAHEFAQAPHASVYMSTGVNMGRQGTLAYWLLQMLSLVTGNLGRRGGNIYSPGYFPAATVGKPKEASPFFDSPFGELRRITGSLPGNLLADYIERGDVKALICMSGNPLLSMAGESRLRAAFDRLELLVVIDIYPNATAQSADYLLPACDWLERADVNSVSLGFQPQPYVQYTEAVVAPKAERKPEWWIFAALLRALGQPSLLDQSNPDPLARLDRQLQHSDLSLQQLQHAEQHTVQLPEPDADDLFNLGVQHKGARVNCFPGLIQRGVARCQEEFDQLVNEDPDALKLITLRTNYMVNSWMHNLPSLKRDHVLDNPLYMHAEDAARLGISEGTEVCVTSDHGKIIATARCDDSLMPGVVAMTHGWGHGNNPQLNTAHNHPGINVNELLPSGVNSYDPLSNMAHMTGINVEVSAA